MTLLGFKVWFAAGPRSCQWQSFGQLPQFYCGIIQDGIISVSLPEGSDNVEETRETEICTEQSAFCNVRVLDRDNGELWIFKVQLIEVLFHLIYSRWFSATTQGLRQQPELRRAGGSQE